MRARLPRIALVAASAAALLLPPPAAAQTSEEPLRDLWSEYPLEQAGTGERSTPQERVPSAPEARGNANEDAAQPADDSAGASTSSVMLLAVFAAVVGLALGSLLGTVGRGLALSAVETPARILPRVLSVAKARRGLFQAVRVREQISRRQPVRTRPHPRGERLRLADERTARVIGERVSDGARRGRTPTAPPPTPHRRVPALAAEAETEVCVIGLWRGFVKAQFLAIVLRPDGSEHVAVMSPRFRWGSGAAPSSDQDFVWKAFEGLLDELEAGGWEWVEPGEAFPDLGARRGGRLWYELRFRRHASPTLRDLAEHREYPRSAGGGGAGS